MALNSKNCISFNYILLQNNTWKIIFKAIYKIINIFFSKHPNKKDVINVKY